MKETLQRLEKLQSIDTLIASLKSEIIELPKQMEATATTREAAREELKQTEETLEGMEHERRDLEGELPVENERLVKYKTQLNLIKNNKEYTAVLHEIEATEKKIGNLEEQILIKMEGIDAAKARPESPYKGRPPSINPERVWQLRQDGKGASAIAKELGIARSSVYRLLEEAA